MPLKIAVLCGGNSEEREISFASAAMVAPVLGQIGHIIQVFDIGSGLLTETNIKGRLPLPSSGLMIKQQVSVVNKRLLRESLLFEDTSAFDLVFIALHGGIGEDGTIQAALDLMNIPYTGSGHAASAVCLDKDLSKRLLRAAGIRTPDWKIINRQSIFFPKDFCYPVVVKPNRQGSTVGLSIVKTAASLVTAVEFAFRFDTEVVIEQFIAGREFTVGILNNRPLTVGEILIDEESIFDYEQKYTPGAVSEQFPADIAPELATVIKQMALAAHQTLKLEDYSRADFRLDRNNKPWLLEVNSLPGLTRTSLMPQSALASGIDFSMLCESICQLSMNRWAKSKKLVP